MKTLIPILIGLLVVGCGKKEELTKTAQSDRTEDSGVTTADELNILDGVTSTATRLVYDTVAATPESVVGTFVIDEDSVWAGGAYKKVILQDNGVIRLYPGVWGVASDGDEQKWHINDAGEVSVKDYSDLKFKATSNGRLILFGKFGEIEYKRVKDTKPTSETKEPAEGEKKFIETKAKAEAGDAEAQYFLGAMYVDDGSTRGNGWTTGNTNINLPSKGHSVVHDKFLHVSNVRSTRKLRGIRKPYT